MSSGDIDYFYTVHPNWKWVVEEAIHLLCSNSNVVPIASQLPSQIMYSQRREKDKTLQKIKYLYALFRLEMTSGASVWASSTAFASLDAKDALYRVLRDKGSEHLMPRTTLLNYDIKNEEDIGDFPSNPAILKAALGSGGDCLYIVKNAKAVLDIVDEHRHKAEGTDGFIDSLVRDYGAVPQWSLQELHIPICIGQQNERRTQFRVYAVYSMKNKSIFVYYKAEVRLPCWEVGQGIEEFGDEAKPYNQGRDKKLTNRCTVEEIPELSHLEKSLVGHTVSAMQALRSHISQAVKDSDSGHCAENTNEIAIVGVDLIVSSIDGRPYIVEFNNNPAIPGPTKSMSSAYRCHLIEFITRLFEFNDPTSEKLFHFFVPISVE